jgi:hypothetical protein
LSPSRVAFFNVIFIDEGEAVDLVETLASLTICLQEETLEYRKSQIILRFQVEFFCVIEQA